MSENEGLQEQRDRAARDETEHLPSPGEGHPADDTTPYGGDTNPQQGTPPIGDEDQAKERTTTPAEDETGVPPLHEHP